MMICNLEDNSMLYIMRHGKTEWNEMHKLQGRTDIALNNEGIAMARAAREEYRDTNIDLCFSSPLVRAKETAEILLSGRDVPIITDDRLKEMSFGEYEGLEYSFKDANCPIDVIFTKPEEYRESIGGAETFEELYERTWSFLSERVFPEVENGKDVLIVGHGAMNSAIVCQIKGLPISEFWSSGLEQCKLLMLM